MDAIQSLQLALSSLTRDRIDQFERPWKISHQVNGWEEQNRMPTCSPEYQVLVCYNQHEAEPQPRPGMPQQPPIACQSDLTLFDEFQIGYLVCEGSRNLVQLRSLTQPTRLEHTLYDFRILRLSLRSPKEDILTSLPTATIRSASFKIITWRRPEGVRVSSCGSEFVKSGRVFVDNSRGFFDLGRRS
jgi:hypothetical protein